MVEYDEDTTIPALIKGLLDDARNLIREELQLARAEIREEISTAQAAIIAFAASAVAGLIGAVLLCLAIGSALAYFLTLPAWAGYGIVAVLLLGGAWAAVSFGRRRLSALRAIPQTTETLKENLAWMQNRSAAK